MPLSSAFADSRIALVIGQSAYRAVPALPNPANDATAVAKMLSDAGFEVQQAADLTQADMRKKVSDFAALITEKGPDATVLVFYAGHGMQLDGENYLMPVDIDPKRDTDVALQAVRLNDILNTLTSVPSKTRIVLLDACRNNPFSEINRKAPRGLAQVDVQFGTPGTLLAYSTSPGAEAEDGTGANSPYTTALLEAGRTPGLPIEEAFKRVRLSVNKATDGRQTPWESSSLVSDFRFFALEAAAAAAGTVPAPVDASISASTVDQWKVVLRGKSDSEANDIIVYDGSEAAYEAYVALYTSGPLVARAKAWLDLHYRSLAWRDAVILNTAAGYRAFIARYPDSDLAPTARKLAERINNRPDPVNPAVAALTAPTCPCTTQPAAEPAKKRAEPAKKQPKQSANRADRRPRPELEEEVIVRRPPPAYDPTPAIIGTGLGVIIGGGMGGGGGYDRGPSRMPSGGNSTGGMSTPGSRGRY